MDVLAAFIPCAVKHLGGNVPASTEWHCVASENQCTDSLLAIVLGAVSVSHDRRRCLQREDGSGRDSCNDQHQVVPGWVDLTLGVLNRETVGSSKPGKILGTVSIRWLSPDIGSILQLAGVCCSQLVGV